MAKCIPFASLPMASFKGKHVERAESEVTEAVSTGATKKCRYCGIFSNSPSEWPLMGTPLQAWDPYVPWGRGRGGKPSGDKCKACQIAPRPDVKFFLFLFSTFSNFQLNISIYFV